jgi:hypothetical protein
MIKTSNKLQLHYFFSDTSHTMNATVKNECEKELLHGFKELITSLDFHVEIETEALNEGGLKETWKFVGKNGIQISIIISIIIQLWSRIPVENKELIDLQIENLQLDNEIKKHELKKIKHELLNNDTITDEVVERVIEYLEKDYKLIWHKSNFYKKLNLYPKVIKITTTQLDENNSPTDDEKTILRNEFQHFILRSDKFPANIDEEALIDIICPVLKKGNFQWKGFYKGQVISFEMRDTIFKKSVLDKQIEFVNGTAIKCVLNQNRKLDEIGQIQIVKNEVLTVIEVILNNTVETTEQGKKYKRDKGFGESQLRLDL